MLMTVTNENLPLTKERIEKLKAKCDKERDHFYKKVDNARRIDNSFALEGDAELTEEEIGKINEFWGKYSFAYPNIDYQFFKTFKNRFGRFDEKNCPGAIRTQYFWKHFNNESYYSAYRNKALTELQFPTIAKPKTVFRRINAIYYDAKFNIIPFERAVELAMEQLNTGNSIIFKLNNTFGGKGVSFMDAGATAEQLKKVVADLPKGNDFVVQLVMRQSEFMNRFNPNSVNTIRITTLLYKDRVSVLAAALRIGKLGNRVDNFSSGGSVIGIDIAQGKLNNWGLDNGYGRIFATESGIDLQNEQLYIPNFDKVKSSVTRLHAFMPYITMVSWDIALSEENEPTLIENNFAGMIQLHQATTGPLFGEHFAELLDEYLIEKFCFEDVYEGFYILEYSDRVEVINYLAEGCFELPESLKEKPVTVVSEDCRALYEIRRRERAEIEKAQMMKAQEQEEIQE